ncbi:unannotated protein [freshwater metagenome]|uniref:Unannotated protein n=1 Tax=freshwater metagenome TaxID=449393 RepID=A0A6J7XTX9_9ZZZZ|nr:hypothetical protein [Actinomycetota bacterium]
MKSLVPIVVILAMASAYGFWHRVREGRIQGSKSKAQAITAQMLGSELGSRVTLVQFSSAFCTPCRTTRVLLEQLTKDLDDVKHLHIDAESHLELVRKLHILSTPTTLILDRNGIEVGRAVGAPKRDDVLSAIAAVR